MILFPAIDLKDGECVRLHRATWPAPRCSTAIPPTRPERSQRQGFEWLHLVDLDGAFAGKPVNAAAVERILDAVSIPVQLGGGIRDRATIDALARGASRA